ncbi:MAG TPA: pantoate--beta-alanine ligase [Planctomycetaceae bacterium]|nr:pantoate--beta-alanine ligase [Planctomycetaceae bacterium]
MIIAEQVADVRRAVRDARRRDTTIGCVPTMGALHAGHESLIEACRAECNFTAVTIFVNPTQFGPGEDFDRYPRPLEEDLARCRRAGVDLVFVPAVELLYPAAFSTYVDVEPLSRVLEGASRPGHFRGVATVVLKLLNIVEPDRAYFGRKDFQQQLLVRKMCRELDLAVEIRTCPTVREPDGLALSSRNRYLNPGERQTALALYRSLQLAQGRLQDGERDAPAIASDMRQFLETAGARPDYAIIADPESLDELTAPRQNMVALVAARVGRTRLIDNLPITLESRA